MDSNENEPTSSTHVPDDSNSSTQQKTFNAKNQFNEASIDRSMLNMNDGDAYSVTNRNNNKTSGAGTVIQNANITNMVSGGSGNSDTPQQINPATDSQPPQQVGEGFHIKIWKFAIQARGKTAMILSVGGIYIVCQSLNIIHDLCQAFASHPNQAATCIAQGSINVYILTKGDEAIKSLLQDYFSGKITREVKKIVEEALKKEYAECEIESVTLTEVGVVMADQEVFDDIKRETEQTLSQPSTSQDLFKNEITLSTTLSILCDKYQVMTEKIFPTATEEDVINEIRNLELRLHTRTMAVALPESISKSLTDLPLNPEADAKRTGGEVLRLFHSRRVTSSSSNTSSDEDEPFVFKRLESLQMKSSDAEPIKKSVGSGSSALEGTQSRELDSPEYCYNMNHHERGCFLIFIQTRSYYFMRRYRKVINNQAKKLKNIAKELGFEHVRIIENETEANIEKLLTELSQADHSNYDCFACAILGCCINLWMHVVHVRDGYMYIEDFMEPFSADNCKSLAMKPKLFFINNSFATTRDVRLLDMHIPADFVVVNSTSTLPEHSTFIQCLCATMEDHGDTMEIMQAVAQANRMIAREYSSDMFPFNQMKIPTITSSLTQKVYFPRKKMMTLVSRMEVYEHSAESISKSQSTSEKHPADLPLNPEVLRLFHSRRVSSSSSNTSSDEDEPFVFKRLESLLMKLRRNLLIKILLP